MDEALRVVIEMTESIWEGFKKDLEDVTPEEASWQPLPEANSITVILRHLCIEATWHQASLERGEQARFFPDNPTFPSREPDNTPRQPTSGAGGTG